MSSLQLNHSGGTLLEINSMITTAHRAKTITFYSVE